MGLQAEQFEPEIQAALKSYERHIVCLEKTPDECGESLHRLIQKAIRAYESRGEGMRHGIALDAHVTIILSQVAGERPICGIYFNLHSPYSGKKPPA